MTYVYIYEIQGNSARYRWGKKYLWFSTRFACNLTIGPVLTAAQEQLINSFADVDGRHGTRTLQLELLREPGAGAQWFSWVSGSWKQISVILRNWIDMITSLCYLCVKFFFSDEYFTPHHSVEFTSLMAPWGFICAPSVSNHNCSCSKPTRFSQIKKQKSGSLEFIDCQRRFWNVQSIVDCSI